MRTQAYLLVILLLLPFVEAQVTSKAEIENQKPEILDIEVFHSEEFEEAGSKFRICNKEDQATVYVQVVVEDRNSYEDVSKLGKVSALLYVKSKRKSNPLSYPEFTLKESTSTTQAVFTLAAQIPHTGKKTQYELIVIVEDGHKGKTKKSVLFEVQNTKCGRNLDKISNLLIESRDAQRPQEYTETRALEVESSSIQATGEEVEDAKLLSIERIKSDETSLFLIGIIILLWLHTMLLLVQERSKNKLLTQANPYQMDMRRL